MKTRVICIVLIVLTMGLFAVAQETANSYTSDASSQVKTLDYVAKFITAKGGLGNSRIFDNGTNVGIGTAAPAATLDVNGTVNAATSFNLQGNPFAFGSYGNGNVFLGFAGNVTTTGSNNTATGQGALASNTTGAFNTANGLQALFFNTTGDYNVASGEGALTSNTTGSENTASGYGALVYNTTGGYNTATGFFALWANNGSNNTANGSWALTYNTTGTYNAGDGAYALYSNTTGYGNTANGLDALYSNTTGTYNTAVGYTANVGSGSLTNATAIGAESYVTQSNSLVLGSVNGVNGASANTNVGIGTSAPSRIFTIGQGLGHAIADGWNTYSSRRWKTNIQTLHGALGKVEQLRGVSYDLKANGQHEVGVIAEEVGAVVPEVVTWEKNGKDAQSVDYGRLTALLIEATKEQEALIHKQQEQIVRLNQQVKTIQATLKTNGRNSSAIRTVKAEDTTVRQ